MITTSKRDNVSYVISGLATIDQRIMGAAAVGLARGLELTRTKVEEEYLSGPKSPTRLGPLTGRLRDSITVDVKPGADKVTGRMGTVVPYGGYHEFGFHGTMEVSAHTRTNSILDVTGKEIELRRMLFNRGGHFLGFKDTKTEAAKHVRAAFVFQSQVKAHTREVDYDGRPFLRPALVESEPMIIEQIKQEISEVKP